MSSSAVGRGGLCTAGFIFLLYMFLYVASYGKFKCRRPSVGALGHFDPASEGPRWISVPNQANFTSNFLARWRHPPSRPCQRSHTASISISGLDGVKSPIRLVAGIVHEFVMMTFDEGGRPRCSGGDYFEIDLSGDSWKSRPPITDHGNGSYTFRMQVDPSFAGDYNLTVILLYRSFDGLKFEVGLVNREASRNMLIAFYRDEGTLPLPKIEQCRRKDFNLDLWAGRWTRLAKNDTCEIDHYGRYHCLDPGIRCREPWCRGPLAPLESNGWVYSAHCSFEIFTQDSAWRCLANKWLFLWGDSNHMDTIRNLLNFVLGMVPEVPEIPRRIDGRFANPKNGSESLRITSIFNGHYNVSMNYLGLRSLRNEEFRRFIRGYFNGETFPDVIILNSGLHDGTFWENIEGFARGAEYAAEFWDGIMRRVREKARDPPKVFYRSTVATAGKARGQLINPSKMEAYNGVLLEKLRERGLINGGVIDAFDMTFPWHYDNRYSDGPHYGRRPANKVWRDGQVGHHYSVDLMLCHVLLNAICNG